MAHLTPAELLDLVEDVRPESAFEHLSGCSSCKQQLADLRSTMTAVARVEVPEPSPLFWDHLSARIRESVASEPPVRSVFGRWGWLRLNLIGVGALAVVALIVVSRIDRTPTAGAIPSSTPQALEPLIEAYGGTDDPSLSFVADLAADLDWEAANEAGLTTHIGVDNDAFAGLSDSERQQLRDLLSGELAHPSS